MNDLAAIFFDQIEETSKQIKCVSFDFFDTLFVRPLEDPEDAFSLMERKLSYKSFKQKRLVAQTIAFRKMAEQGNYEITLNEIYKWFDETNDELRLALMQAEYDLELKLLEPNLEVFAFFRNCLAEHKQVVITSDMYLPKRFFQEALQKEGLEDIPLFISSDKNATKRDRGDLFEVIQQELSLPADEILHIGDNAISDVVRAQEKGLRAVHYLQTRRRQITDSPSLVKSLAYGLLRTQRLQLKLSSNYGEIGFLYGGPAASGFLDWIQEQCDRDSVEHLLFLARDGFVLERLIQNRNDFKNINCHYFLGSRVAFTLAAMTLETFEGFIPFLLSGADGLFASELLERIGVQPPAAAVMQDLELGSDFRIAPENYPTVAAFLRAYQREILKIATLNRRGLYQYLHQANIRPGSRVALVDVGWSGTTQEAFERAVADMMPLDVQGYYFCLADTPKRLVLNNSQKMKALLTSESMSTDIIAALYQNRVAIEMMFSAPHHTVIGLQPHDSKIHAIFDPGRGLDPQAAKEILAINRDIAQGIEAFDSCYSQLLKKLNFNKIMESLEMAKPIIELALSKDNDDISWLTAVKNFDAWGSSRHYQLDLNTYRNASSESLK